VAFIDPRTGRLMWRKEGWTQEDPLTAETFAEQAMDFCSRNSFDRPPAAPRPSGTKISSVPQKRSVETMTEEEQLEMAMKASIDDLVPPSFASTQNGVANQSMNTTDDTFSGSQLKKEPVSDAIQSSLIDELLQMTVDDEPMVEGNARLQFRMPDGIRIVRRFTFCQSLRIVYAFVAVSIYLRVCHFCNML
jgi:UBX domain-containing protein 7